MYEVDEESPGTTIIDGTTDDAEETPRKRVIRKVDDDEEDEDELEKAAARKADDEDSEVERTKVTTPGKIIERDGSQVSLPDRRKIISRKYPQHAASLADRLLSATRLQPASATGRRSACKRRLYGRRTR